MMRGDFNGRCLILEKLIAELRRDAELRKAISSFLCEVISNLNVNVIRRNDSLASPALLNDLDKLSGNVDAPFVVPLCVKPSGEFLSRVAVEHIDIEFPLVRQPGERQVAAAQIPDDRVDLIGTKKKI